LLQIKEGLPEKIETDENNAQTLRLDVNFAGFP